MRLSDWWRQQRAICGFRGVVGLPCGTFSLVGRAGEVCGEDVDVADAIGDLVDEVVNTILCQVLPQDLS